MDARENEIMIRVSDGLISSWAINGMPMV
jgi:hypothetical protein